MTIESLKALQKRVREATGPDRELDVEIARALRPGQLWCAEHPFAPEDVAANFTTDPDGLGACVALQRDVLPGCEWSRDRSGDFWILGEVSPGIWCVIEGCERLSNDCLTFIGAIFAARIAELEAEQENQTEKAG